MSLFPFTMQQVASIPSQLSKGGFRAIRTHLSKWLRRQHLLSSVCTLLDDTQLVVELGLGSWEIGELINELEVFYSTQLSDIETLVLATVGDLEAAPYCQLDKATSNWEIAFPAAFAQNDHSSGQAVAEFGDKCPRFVLGSR